MAIVAYMGPISCFSFLKNYQPSRIGLCGSSVFTKGTIMRLTAQVIKQAAAKVIKQAAIDGNHLRWEIILLAIAKQLIHSQYKIHTDT